MHLSLNIVQGSIRNIWSIYSKREVIAGTMVFLWKSSWRFLTRLIIEYILLHTISSMFHYAIADMMGIYRRFRPPRMQKFAVLMVQIFWSVNIHFWKVFLIVITIVHCCLKNANFTFFPFLLLIFFCRQFSLKIIFITKVHFIKLK